MLPRWHIILGLIFSIVLSYIFPSILLYEAIIVFLSSFLIDFDHYLVAVLQTKRLSLFESFKFYKKLAIEGKKRSDKGIRIKGFMMIFHTLEFNLLVLLIGLFVFRPFLFVFIGMVFHSLCDIIYLIYKDIMYHRHFLLTPWIFDIYKQKKKK